MKKTLFLISALWMLIGISAQAQVKGGIRAGLNVANWGGDAKESFQEALDATGALTTEAKPGFHAGAYLQLPLSPYVSLEPGLYYSGKGIRVTQTLMEEGSFLNPKVTITDNAHYLELPLMLRVNVTPGFNFYAGPQVAYLLKSEVNVEAGLFGLSYDNTWEVDPGLRKLDFGLAGGLGYEFMNGINLQAGYEYGLSSLDEGASNVDAFNRVVKVSLGYTFGK